MKEKVHVFNEVLTERYLGLPTDVGRSKGGVFKYLKDRVWSKVQGWMEQSLPVGHVRLNLSGSLSARISIFLSQQNRFSRLISRL